MVDWSQSERKAWHWSERLQPSAWIEQNVRIPDNSFNAEPGPYSFDRTPYWRDVVDLAANPNVKEIWCYKANQVGFTQMLMAFAAYCAAQQPGAMGILMPDEDSVDELFKEELKPLLEATPATRALKSGRSWDETKHEIWLQTMPIIGLYAGSASKLEKRKFRYGLGDEINLYRDIPGQPSALRRLLIRLTTWGHHGKAFFGSKPTTTEGAITKGYESSPDKRRYLMPCARCGFYHEWLWSHVKGFKGAQGSDRFERANWVKLNKPCFYECPNCRKTTDESERLRCVQAGRWVSGSMEGDVWTPVQKVGEGGRVIGDPIRSERVGVYVWSIVSPWVTMNQMAAEFIEAEGDSEATRSFRNTRLALPHHEIQKSIRPSIVRDKREISGPPLIVPRWASALFCTVDTQPDWFAYTVRAWGGGYKSALVAYGIITEANAPVSPDQRKQWAWDEVYKIGLQSRFEIEGGGVACPQWLLIDSGGDRTNEVYEFSLRDPRILPTKGMSRPNTKLFYDTEPKPGIRLWMIDVGHFKGALWSLLNDADATKWTPHRDVPEQYCMEMASESLMKIKGKWMWMTNGTARNEAWDCEVLQRAAAEMANLGGLPSIEQTQAQQQEPAPKPERERPSWMPDRPSNWLSR